MIQAGQIVLFAFPRTDLQKSKMRPALVLRALPGQYSDWLICMISSNTHQCIPEFFNETGLKRESVIRTTRLA
ncbi:MAG: type II toxin-antitoxin system PemK/MazF family toxin, partial [Candidatus Sumerlaeia bacterium]